MGCFTNKRQHPIKPPSTLTTTDMADSGNESRHVPHPSEALEFATTALQPHMENIDFITTPSRLENRESRSSRGLTGSNSLVDSADAGIKAEHRLTLRDGLSLYRKAIGWSILLSLTIVMEGYDLTIINSFYALPQFQMAYGEQSSPTDYQITTVWQSALTNGAIVGEIFGLLFNGHFTEIFGYRYTLMAALVALCMFIFLAVFAVNISLLMASEVLCGISWGVFQTLSTTYAAEIMPVALRAYLTSNVNLCWLIGQIIGTGVLRGLVNLDSQWSYRIPFVLQWVWAVPILAGVLFAPESPWWLVRHQRSEQAKMALLRLTKKGSENFDAEETISLMKQTNELEKKLGASHSYIDCFKGVNLRRTEIACMVWMIQTLCGSPMTGYATYFYVQAGFDPERAFDLSLGMYGMAIVGAMISWFLLPLVGRRTLYLWGTGLCFFILIVAGSVGTQPAASWVSWTLGSLVIMHTFVYDTTIGPVCYSLVAEIPSTRLRVKTVVLARVAYNIVGIVSNVLMPKMLNPTAWNWKGKTCFVWAGTCLFSYIWCFYRLPEPKGLTYLELDILFEKKVKARKFRRVQDILVKSGYFQIPGPNEGNDLTDWRGITI